jgi:selenide,water dikinase
MPIVDDPTDFGQIASVNAISDIYAMGGTPLLAIAILGWPVDKIPAEVAAKVLEGSRAICAEASIPLAGGHSIDCPEPVFGLAVTGLVHPSRIKRNAGAENGNLLYLTKAIGVGILSTAQKKGLSNPGANKAALESMTRLNLFGEKLGSRTEVKALTDVTGFGLLGHLGEICDAASLSAEINFSAVPLIPEAAELLAKGCIPGGTNRNLASYGSGIGGGTEEQKQWLADPQTSGGLLIAVDPAFRNAFEEFALQYGHELQPIGRLTEKKAFRIQIL